VALLRRACDDIGGIPIAVPVFDSRNPPDERIMLVFLSYLFSRLLASFKEIRAVVRIQRFLREKMRRGSTSSRVSNSDAIGSSDTPEYDFSVRILQTKREARKVIRNYLCTCLLRRRFHSHWKTVQQSKLGCTSIAEKGNVTRLIFDQEKNTEHAMRLEREARQEVERRMRLLEEEACRLEAERQRAVREAEEARVRAEAVALQEQNALAQRRQEELEAVRRAEEAAAEKLMRDQQEQADRMAAALKVQESVRLAELEAEKETARRLAEVEALRRIEEAKAAAEQEAKRVADQVMEDGALMHVFWSP